MTIVKLTNTEPFTNWKTKINQTIDVAESACPANDSRLTDSRIATTTGLTERTTPSDSDEFPLQTSGGNPLKILWSTIFNTIRAFNFTNRRVPFSNGTNLTSSDDLTYNDSTKVLSVNGQADISFLKLKTDITPVTLSTGQSQWNEDLGTIETGLLYGSVLQHGMEVLRPVINNTGTTIPNGTPLMFVGSSGNSGKIKVKAWDGTTASYFLGIATSDINPTDGTEGQGYSCYFGDVNDINTTGGGESWQAGDVIYLGLSSGLTNNPSNAFYPRIIVGSVLRAHSTTGRLAVCIQKAPTSHSHSNTEITSFTTGLPSQTTLVDTDEIPLQTSGGTLKKVAWSVINAAAKAFNITTTRIPFSDGTNLTSSADLAWDNTSKTLTAGKIIVLKSQDNTLWNIEVSNEGVISATEVT